MSIENLFLDQFPDMKPSGNGQFKARCIFHNEKDPSLSIKLPEGIYYCHGCSAEGNAVTLAKFLNIDPTPYYTIKRNSQSINRSAITTKKEEAVLTVEERHYFFSQQANEYNQCITGLIKAGKTGNYNLTPKTVTDFLLGYDPKRKVLVFPITLTNGKIFALKYHKQSFSGGKAVWYPQHLICHYKKDVLLIVEGEKDAVNAYNMEFQVATNTTGAGSVPIDMRPVEGFKEYIIWYDFDRAGNLGSRTMAAAVAEAYPDSKVSIVDWRYEEETYQLKDGHDISDLIKDGRSDIIKSIYDNRQQYKPEPSNRKGYNLIPITEALRLDIQKPAMIIEDIINERCNTLLTATDNVGKSMMANQIACCIATGTDFLGYKVPKARKVALVQHEMENGEQLDRLKLQTRRFLEMHPDLMTENLSLHIIEDDENLMVTDQFEVIENTLMIDPDIEVMVFDNIGQSTRVAMTDPDAIRNELKRLKAICRKYSVAFLLVAHHNKIDYNSEMDLKKEYIQGGKPVTDWADNVIQLHTSSINPNLVLFKITKIRSVHDKDGITTKLVNQAVKFNQDNDLLFTNRMAISKWEAHFKATDKYDREMTYLRELARRGEFTTLEALNESALMTPPIAGSTIKGRWLPKFCKYGWIEKVKHGHYKVRDEMIMMLNDPTVIGT